MKYMGSKARLVKYILPIILDGRQNNQTYVEPFAGGMNSICDVKGLRIANDSNYFLIEMWRDLIAGWVPPKITRGDYVQIRDNKDKYTPSLVGWVGFNCSYSGKWFGGFAGEVKTKAGPVRDYQDEALRNVLKQVGLMKGVTFSNKSYSELDIPSESIIYCDPPYVGTTCYFEKFNSELFWEWVREKSQHGHSVFVSEYDAPEDFECIWSREVKSSLSANGSVGGSKVSVERLFVYSKGLT